jgi:hypothetical protein
MADGSHVHYEGRFPGPILIVTRAVPTQTKAWPTREAARDDQPLHISQQGSLQL